MKHPKTYEVAEVRRGFRATVKCPYCSWSWIATHSELGYAVKDCDNEIERHFREYHRLSERKK